MTLQKLEQLHEKFILTAAVKPVGTQAYIKIVFKAFTTRDKQICRNTKQYSERSRCLDLSIQVCPSVGKAAPNATPQCHSGSINSYRGRR